MYRVAIITLAAGVLAVLASSGRASLHHPTDPMALLVNAKGEPEALPFGEFSRRRLVLRNVGNEKWPLDNPDPNDPSKRVKTERGVVRDRIDALQKLPNRTQEQSVGLATDLLRFNKADEADGALQGKHRQGYLGAVTLAHIATSQADPDDAKSRNWSRALTFLLLAGDEAPPKEFPGLGPQQLAWQIKLNRGALTKFVRLRRDEARGPKLPPEDELPDRLFDVSFGPGAPAPSELAKLPPDALATVQQLVLWFPNDTRLYWLLGELYAAKGEYAAAKKIMDECVDSGHYSNRKVLMQHRETVAQAAKAKGAAPDEPMLAPPDAATAPEDPPPPPVPFSLGAVWVYFGVVALVALFAFVRAMTKKRGPNDCGPVG